MTTDPKCETCGDSGCFNDPGAHSDSPGGLRLPTNAAPCPNGCLVNIVTPPFPACKPERVPFGSLRPGQLGLMECGCILTRKRDGWNHYRFSVGDDTAGSCTDKCARWGSLEDTLARPCSVYQFECKPAEEPTTCPDCTKSVLCSKHYRQTVPAETCASREEAEPQWSESHPAISPLHLHDVRVRDQWLAESEAKRASLQSDCATLRSENERLREAIRWALGEPVKDGDFAESQPPATGPRYWWRKELRSRAGLDPPSTEER